MGVPSIEHRSQVIPHEIDEGEGGLHALPMLHVKDIIGDHHVSEDLCNPCRAETAFAFQRRQYGFFERDRLLLIQLAALCRFCVLRSADSGARSGHRCAADGEHPHPDILRLPACSRRNRPLHIDRGDLCRTSCWPAKSPLRYESIRPRSPLPLSGLVFSRGSHGDNRRAAGVGFWLPAR